MGLRDALGGLFGGGDAPPAGAVEDPSDPPVPVDRLREAADEAAADRPDLDLDFSPASLARLDDAVADREASVPDPDDPAALLADDEVLALGAYLGETLIRTHGGRWEYAGGWSVHLGSDGDVVEVPAFEVAAWSLAGEPTFQRVAEGAADELADDGDSATDQAPAGGPGPESGPNRNAGRGPPRPADREAPPAAAPDEGDDEGYSQGPGPAVGDRDVSGATPVDETSSDERSAGARHSHGNSSDERSPAESSPGDTTAAGPPTENEALAARYEGAAETLVEAYPEAGLDGSVVSLARLDEVVAAADEEIRDGPGLAAAGGYFAAVLRREHGAVWQDRDGEVLVLRGPDGEAVLTPYALAASVVTGEETFVRAYARAAADCGLAPSMFD